MQQTVRHLNSPHISHEEANASFFATTSTAVGDQISACSCATAIASALEGMEQSHMQLMMIIDRCMDFN